MSNSIIHECGTFNITPESDPTPVTVGETWRRIPRLSRPMPTAGVLGVAEQVRPYMQGARGDYTPYNLAQDMTGDKGWAVAYYGNEEPDKVLAFSMIYECPRTFKDRARRLPHEYHLKQFGVTTKHDVTKTSPNGIPSHHYFRAAAALLHCAVSSVDPRADVYIEEHPGETRTGTLFKVAGFQAYENPTNPTAPYVPGARAGEILEALEAHPSFSFLRSQAP